MVSGARCVKMAGILAFVLVAAAGCEDGPSARVGACDCPVGTVCIGDSRCATLCSTNDDCDASEACSAGVCGPGAGECSTPEECQCYLGEVPSCAGGACACTCPRGAECRCVVDGDCEDANPCTVDTCVDEVCAHDALSFEGRDCAVKRPGDGTCVLASTTDSVCMLKQGELCTASTECVSGSCKNGYCCESTCTGCQRCDASGHEGTCTAAVPDCEGKCLGGDDECGGTCPTNDCLDGCCSWDAQCVAYEAQGDGACGAAGATCADCVAVSGVCEAVAHTCCVPSCDGKCAGASDGCGGTCSRNDCEGGCCTADNVCLTYAQQNAAACGDAGAACVDCSVDNLGCNAGHTCSCVTKPDRTQAQVTIASGACSAGCLDAKLAATIDGGGVYNVSFSDASLAGVCEGTSMLTSWAKSAGGGGLGAYFVTMSSSFTTPARNSALTQTQFTALQIGIACPTGKTLLEAYFTCPGCSASLVAWEPCVDNVARLNVTLPANSTCVVGTPPVNPTLNVTCQ